MTNAIMSKFTEAYVENGHKTTFSTLKLGPSTGTKTVYFWFGKRVVIVCRYRAEFSGVYKVMPQKLGVSLQGVGEHKTIR